MTKPAIEMAQTFVSQTQEFATAVYNQGIIDGTANILTIIKQTENITVDNVKQMCESFIGKTLEDDPHLSCPPVLVGEAEKELKENPLANVDDIDNLSAEELAQMIEIPDELVGNQPAQPEELEGMCHSDVSEMTEMTNIIKNKTDEEIDKAVEVMAPGPMSSSCTNMSINGLGSNQHGPLSSPLTYDPNYKPEIDLHKISNAVNEQMVKSVKKEL